jgi:RNA recognition motif-containing protein
MSCNLHVGNLGRHTTANDLWVIFATHGEVVDTEVITDRNSGRSRGFGFVQMASPQDAKAVIEAVNGHLIDGRGITVAVALDRHR